MSTIDIRQDGGTPSSIRVADRNPSRYIAELVYRNFDYEGVIVKDSSGGTRELDVTNKEHAENLIKGLQKAIELGWLK